jgi:hypothetical protein
MCIHMSYNMSFELCSEFMKYADIHQCRERDSIFTIWTAESNIFHLYNIHRKEGENVIRFLLLPHDCQI